MNREQYLIFRTNNTPEPLYEFYKENIGSHPLLNVGDFFRAMQAWPHNMEAYSNVLLYYDIKFEIVKITDKKGNILRFL